MLLNFALESVGTKVSCNKISTDGYESTNLTSPEFSRRKKGFLAEHFIKPPVDVTFTFPCHVNICTIFLDSFVGQQSSSQLEVYSASRPAPKTKHGQKRAEESKQPWSFSQQLPLFYQVSKIDVPQLSRVGFRNSRFPSHLSCQQDNVMNSPPSTAVAEMRHSKAEILTSATDLTIRISRTKNGSTCALSNVEIWGCVSTHVNDTLRKSIHESYNAFINPNPNINLSSRGLKTETFNSNKSKMHCEETESHIRDGIHVPEEFTDPLTCELMSIPMLLPSGKNVDKSTLDKYFESEASHGRQPRDPFTGVEFYGEAKPVPNGALKARIDKFLSENSHNSSIALLPRTVKSGDLSSLHRKRQANATMETSSLIKHSKNVTETQTESFTCKNEQIRSIDKKVNKQTRHATATSASGTSSTSVLSSSQSSTLVSFDKNKICSSDDSQESDSSVKTGSKNQNVKANNEEKTHESCLKNSLDNALSALLGSLSPEIYDNCVNSSVPEPTYSCFKCNTQLLKDIVAYTIPCSHSVCRSCLLTYPVTCNNIQCLLCQKTFLRSEAVRIHSINK